MLKKAITYELIKLTISGLWHFEVIDTLFLSCLIILYIFQWATFNEAYQLAFYWLDISYAEVDSYLVVYILLIQRSCSNICAVSRENICTYNFYEHKICLENIISRIVISLLRYVAKSDNFYFKRISMEMCSLKVAILYE